MAVSAETRTSFAESLFEKALLKIRDREFERAAGLLAEAIKVRPNFAEAWLVRGNVRMSQDQHFDALLHFDRALEIAPEKWDAWNNRGLAFANIGLWEAAEDAYRKSLQFNPSPDPHLNLGNLYCHLMRLSDAEREYRAALEYFQDNLHIHINLGLSLLGQGKWKEGWEHYEARHANSPYQMRSRRAFSPWRGEPLIGRTILLFPEQGLGDEILFSRFATTVKERGAKRVILEAMPPLVRIMRTVPGVDEVMIKNDTLPEGIDCSCAIMDVPMMLGMGPADVPLPSHYMRAERRPWGLPAGLNVGLCWQSGQRPLQPSAAATAANKSIPLLWLKDLVQPGVNLVSLQLENPDANLANEMGIIDHTAGIGDLADTASLIAELDLVITTDSAVAHIAAALGRPVWNMVRHAGYWPWLHPDLDHSWYPSMRLYRQPTTADWDTPLKAMFADFTAFVQERQKQQKAAA